MRHIAWTLMCAVVAGGVAQADWGASPSTTAKAAYAALGPGYGPPPGYQAPEPPAPPMAGPHPTFMSFMNAPNEKPVVRYGLNPTLRKLMFWKKGDCDNCGAGCSQCGPGAGGPLHGANMGPAPMQGTLVFPNHPYVRSPRDYFMWEPK